ncbi:MAG TPA: threo-3-hydroxy-L-aspartate ammonia-lyase [Usitatibacter sp.]|jgi:threonine dehydratase|nr:threo-3-hydroxy-L-aspartate ammonia-lyase [Usitatibacter sp.]
MNDASPAAGVSYADVEAASRRLAGVAHRTPVATSRQFDAMTGCTAFFKCENLQRMGAFKFRGAYNALAKLQGAERAAGVVAFSSGNHAQAVALAGSLLGIPTTIVMPADAPAVKVAATRGYGAEVVFYERGGGETREAMAERIAREKGARLIPPFDHADVIAGQGTCAKELIEDTGALDYLFVCTGGAGLLSGCAVAATHLSPGIRVIGVEPEAGDDAARSFREKKLHTVDNPQTIADGARTSSMGALTFPLVLRYVSDIMTVSDAELVEAMRFIWERMKLVVEPTGALAAAGVIQRAAQLEGKRVGIILSGGNADLKAVAQLFA